RRRRSRSDAAGRAGAAATARSDRSFLRRFQPFTGLKASPESSPPKYQRGTAMLNWFDKYERVPDARDAPPLPVPEQWRRCFIYGNRNREVVQRRQGVWVHHPRRRRQGLVRPPHRDRRRWLQVARREREVAVRGGRGGEGSGGEG